MLKARNVYHINETIHNRNTIAAEVWNYSLLPKSKQTSKVCSESEAKGAQTHTGAVCVYISHTCSNAS